MPDEPDAILGCRMESRTYEYADCPHRRLNQLSGEWVLVSPQRTMRPWSGLTEPPDRAELPSYDPACYLCPTNTRADGSVNPDYSATFVFTNDFSALLPEEARPAIMGGEELLVSEPEPGICRVICYSPRHDAAMARMQPGEVMGIIDTWQNEYAALGRHSFINHVQIFENRGLLMGCSNPHPHGQIWATATVPSIAAREDEQQRRHLRQRGHCLLCAYLETEFCEPSRRVIAANDSFAALVPFWAVWPYETMIVPRRHARDISELTDGEKRDLAEMMIRLGVCYDNLFQTSFPYSMGIHQQPTDGGHHPHWHWHIHYLPPLLRSRSVRKHMVGYELLAMPQRDLTAEAAAATLRALPKRHYLEEEQ